MKIDFLLVCLLSCLVFIQTQNFCSSYCHQTSCGDTTPNSCTACNYPFTLNASANPKCQIQAPSNWIIHSTETTGTTLSYPGSPTAYSCVQSFYGLLYAYSEKFTLAIPAITTPYWQLQIVYSAIFASSNQPTIPQSIRHKFQGITTLISSNTRAYRYQACGDSKPQWFLQISKTQTISTLNTVFSLEISTDSSNSTMFFGVRQFIILIRKCDPKCQVCSGDTSDNNCTVCTTAGIHQSFYIASNNSCVAACPANHIQVAATHICDPCSSNCTQCQITTSNCTACASSPLQYYLISANNKCVVSADCPTNMYGQLSNKTCSNCNSNCTVCSVSANNCSACVASPQYYLYLTGNLCLLPTDCPIKTYAQLSTKTCSNCNSNCSSCSVASNNCSACVNSPNQYYLYSTSNSCLLAADCPIGTFASSTTKTCSSCNSACTACFGSSTNCSSCVTGPTQYFLISSTFTCVLSTGCPAGRYADTSTSICQSCNSSCLTCSGSPNNCITCLITPIPYYFYSANTSCILPASCPVGTFAQSSSKTCSTCSSICTACFGSSTNCSSCVTGPTQYFLISSTFTCVLSTGCPAGRYADTSTSICQSCNSNCTQCQTSSTNCSACKSTPQYYHYAAGFQCLLPLNCPAATYPESSNNTCTPCNVNCTSCVGTTNNCSACISTFYLYNGVCYNICPISTYPSGLVCLACPSRCLVCNSSTYCSSCIASGGSAGYLTTSNTCVVLCPGGQYGENSNRTCSPCHTSCLTCLGAATTCTSCMIPLYFHLSAWTCLATCPSPNFYGNNTFWTCNPCDNKCLICSGTDKNCTSCTTTGANQAFLFSSNNTCLSNCPNEYFKNSSTHICDQCDPSCYKCTGSPSPCTVCSITYSLYLGACYTVCPDYFYSQPDPNLAGAFICVPCHPSCQQCFGPTNQTCTVCDSNDPYYLSNTTCSLSCLDGFAPMDSGYICVQCHDLCQICYNLADNCSQCKVNNISKFIAYVLPGNGTSQCVVNCPNGYMKNDTNGTCDACNSSCATCKDNINKCLTCVSPLLFLDNKCYVVCPYTYFQNGVNCNKCNTNCLVCQGNSNNCSICNTTIPAFFLTDKCYQNCPNRYFESVADNYTCQSCNISCQICDGNPGPCYNCTDYYYLYEQLCYQACPVQGYFQDAITWQCLSCDDYCVRLQITAQFQSSLQDSIVYTLQFSSPVDFDILNIDTFHSIAFSDPGFTLDMFVVTAQIVSNTTYQVRLKPKRYLFIQNVTVSIITRNLPANLSLYGRAIDGRPFHSLVYENNAGILWFAIISPDMSEYQKQILKGMTQLSDRFNAITTLPGVQDLKKTGLISIMAPGIQITSCVLLVNHILPQNLYQGIRIFATAVFFQVPPWEKQGRHTKYVFNTPINNSQHFRLLEQRKLATSNEWRFQRTGWTNTFVLDNYIQLMMILLCWIVLALCRFVIFKADPFGKAMSRVYSLYHKIHQICILYLTISTILEWITYQQSGERLISLIVSAFMMAYFLGYQVYMFYDMHKFPNAKIGSFTYRSLVCKYGCFLNKIRHDEYQYESIYSFRLWFRPYNYQLLSYYKKVLMMACLPIFHNYQISQISALLAVQIFEIIRFVFTWPYAKKWRNIIKLLLEIMLLVVFIIVLACDILSLELMKNNPNLIQKQAKWFNLLGWIAFIFIVAFNIFCFLFVIYQMLCMNSSFDEVGKIRKKYYFQKLQEYQADHAILEKSLVKKWMQLGNLNDKQYVSDNKVPIISVKIQQVKVCKKGKFFSVSINKVLGLKITAEQDVYEHSQNRVKTTERLKKNIQITQGNNAILYSCFSRIYQKCNVQALESQGFILSTFLTIDTTQYKKGGNVFFHKSDMEQTVQITDRLDNKIKEKTINLGNNLIQQFPLDPKKLRSL